MVVTGKLPSREGAKNPSGSPVESWLALIDWQQELVTVMQLRFDGNLGAP